MSCLYPLVAFIDHSEKKRIEDFQKKFGFKPYHYVPILDEKRSSVLNMYKRVNDRFLFILKKDKKYFGGLSAREYRDQLCAGSSTLEAIDLPCGQCIQCRLANARTWANRLVMESMYSDNALFLTFTYDDEHLPHSSKGFPTLDFEDIREFDKRLTHYLDRKCGGLASPRRFVCGEYGSITGRPHFHSIHFNLPESVLDLKPYKCNFRGDPFFKSDVLSKLWGKGFVIVGQFTWDTACYVARYVTKKLTGVDNEKRIELFGQVQEGIRVSNRPGIGREFYEKNKDRIYQGLPGFDDLGMTYIPRKGRVRSPRYFDKLYDLEDHDQLEQIKALRSTKSQEAHLAMLRDNHWTEDFWRDNQIKLSKNILSKLPRKEI